MQSNQIALEAQRRTAFGKKTRFLRRQGLVPANIFGPGSESIAIQLNTREIQHILTHVPRSTLFSVKLDGDAGTTVLIRGVTRKPTTSELYHIDFYRVSMTHTLKTEVPLILEGDAPAVREFDAVILQAMNSLPIECLPGDIPPQIIVPLDTLKAIDDAIKVGDLPLPPQVKALVDEGELVAKAMAPTVAEVEEVAEAEAAAEGEEAAAAEGEAATAEAAAEAEPAESEAEKD
jgi:large subunit ribosomal protein L25